MLGGAQSITFQNSPDPTRNALHASPDALKRVPRTLRICLQPVFLARPSRPPSPQIQTVRSEFTAGEFRISFLTNCWTQSPRDNRLGPGLHALHAQYPAWIGRKKMSQNSHKIPLGFLNALNCFLLTAQRSPDPEGLSRENARVLKTHISESHHRRQATPL